MFACANLFSGIKKGPIFFTLIAHLICYDELATLYPVA